MLVFAACVLDKSGADILHEQLHEQIEIFELLF